MKIAHWSTEKISRCVLYVLLGIVVIVFALFALVGFDIPYEENPDFNAPLFTDALIVLMWVLLIATIAFAVASIVRSYRESPRAKDSNGIPYRRINKVIGLGVAVCLSVTFALGSTAPMLINGKNYTDTLWLRVADMFVCTALILLVVAVGTMVFGATRYIRKDKRP